MKRITLLITCLFAGVISLPAQDESISDIDGNSYKTVKIGEQFWMAENLKVTRYNNGDSITYPAPAVEWDTTSAGAYCYYNNNPDYIAVFGLLYNWYAAVDERGICPEGWHVPTDEEWMDMEKSLGMSAAEAGRMTAWRGTTEGSKLKSSEFNGTNESGFSALGTGYRDPEGVYKAIHTDNDYWTSTPYSNQGNFEGVLHGLLDQKASVVRNFHVPGYGFCIRCVKNTTSSASLISSPGRDGFYPNPANTFLKTDDPGVREMSILDINGGEILRSTVHGSSVSFDVSSLLPGIYIIRLYGKRSVQSSRLIVN